MQREQRPLCIERCGIAPEELGQGINGLPVEARRIASDSCRDGEDLDPLTEQAMGEAVRIVADLGVELVQQGRREATRADRALAEVMEQVLSYKGLSARAETRD